ncbi:hypothetical protein ACS0TY_019165 [Phlomoides rotata]
MIMKLIRNRNALICYSPPYFLTPKSTYSQSKAFPLIPGSRASAHLGRRPQWRVLLPQKILSTFTFVLKVVLVPAAKRAQTKACGCCVAQHLCESSCGCARNFSTRRRRVMVPAPPDLIWPMQVLFGSNVIMVVQDPSYSYTPAIDIWSIGCIFAEILTGKPLFPGKNDVHQLGLIIDLLGTPPMDTVSRVRNEKARRYLTSMRKKQPVSFSKKFPNVDPLALRLLEKLLAFDPKDRPTAEQALADPYFKGLAKAEREPSCQPISKMEFEFERRRATKEDI